MPSVAEITAAYGNILLAPQTGPEVCDICFNLTAGFSRCFACSRCEQWLHTVAPVSYSVAHEQLHHALSAYKHHRSPAAERITLELAAVLCRYLSRHERCLAAPLGLERLPIVTTVPAGTPERDLAQPLRGLVGEIQPVRDRYERLLVRTGAACPARRFDPARFAATRALHGEPVLLIDDTWTTGASAQSAAAALRGSGSGPVVAVVIGRHLNRGWRSNDQRLRELPAPFDWNRCQRCAEISTRQDGSAALTHG